MQRRHSVTVAIVAAQLAIWPAIRPCRAQTEMKAGRTDVNLALGVMTRLQIDRPFGFVLIGNPHVIDFQTQDERSLLLMPLGLGTTNLVVIDKKGMVITNLTIVVRSAGPI
jgi:Flp pilus assembly secretin CpaC